MLKKEARGRQIGCSGEEYCLGQKESSGDRDIFTNMEGERSEVGDENYVVEEHV